MIKRLTYFISVLMLPSITLAYFASFTTPMTGSSYNIGQTVTLEWTSDIPGNYGSIILYQNGTTIQTINSNYYFYYGTQSYSWTIPSSVPIGSDYQIKLIVPSVGGFYSSTFSINSAGSGVSGHSLSFDGTDDKVLAQSIIFQNYYSLSISMWLKPESFSSTSTNTFLRQDQCSSGDTRIYLANENGSLAFGLTTDSGWHEWDLSYSMNSLLDSWNHLTFTYGSNVKKIFINGVLQGTNSGNSGNMLTCNNGYLTFGSNLSARYYNGNMDEVAIWDDVLTEMEVAAFYNSGNTLTASTN